jgi:tyrosyl-tRNA synthetase
VEANAKTYLDQVGKIVDLQKVELVRNSDWFRDLPFRRLLELASKMTVARLLERDDFSKRHAEGNPIGLHEFIYPLMQGYDSVMVRSDVELGATDQTFNLLVGRDLQRDAGQEPQVCITMPMLVGTDGVMKMSKSYGNHVGISDSPKDMFGKLMSLPDDLMKNYFVLLTDVPVGDVEEKLRTGHPRDVKAELAERILSRFHSPAVAKRESEEFTRVFSDKQAPQDIQDVRVPRDLFEDNGVWIVKLLSHARLAASSSEARRLVKQRAVKLDDRTVDDIEARIEIRGGEILKAGKRKYARLQVE